MYDFHIIKGGVTAPLGFDAAGIRVPIREDNKRKPDLAAIYCRERAIVAGAFTTNVVKAAPVLWDMEIVKKGYARIIVANSGIANAATGKEGYNDMIKIIKSISEVWDIPEEEILVASTGVIGERLPVDRIIKKLPALKKKLGRDIKETYAKAIMTTDTFPKTAAVSLDIDEHIVTIGGVAKGAGMIHPNLATMLAFFTTDVNITKEMLDIAIKRVVEHSFNSITVDGDTSTNDTVLIMSSNMAGNRIIDKEDERFEKFYKALEFVAQDLAKKIVKDGEGATKLITIIVEGLKSYEDAKKIAVSIAKSNLVKTAFFGNDPNWGRILAAAGSAGVDFDPNKIEILLNDIPIVQDGITSEYFEESIVKNEMKKKEVTLVVNFHNGPVSSTVWTCDMTYDYIKINASYRT